MQGHKGTLHLKARLAGVSWFLQHAMPGGSRPLPNTDLRQALGPFLQGITQP